MVTAPTSSLTVHCYQLSSANLRFEIWDSHWDQWTHYSTSSLPHLFPKRRQTIEFFKHTAVLHTTALLSPLVASESFGSSQRVWLKRHLLTQIGQLFLPFLYALSSFSQVLNFSNCAILGNNSYYWSRRNKIWWGWVLRKISTSLWGNLGSITEKLLCRRRLLREREREREWSRDDHPREKNFKRIWRIKVPSPRSAKCPIPCPRV